MNDKEGILVPTLALEYFYKFSHTWSAGIMADLELIEYVIPFLDDLLIRKNALIIAAVSIYEPIESLSVIAGGSIEIEHHHNFAVVRAGIVFQIGVATAWGGSAKFTADVITRFLSYTNGRSGFRGKSSSFSIPG